MEYLLYGLSYDALSQLERLDGDLRCTAYGDWDAVGTAPLSDLLEIRRQEAPGGLRRLADLEPVGLAGQPRRRVKEGAT